MAGKDRQSKIGFSPRANLQYNKKYIFHRGKEMKGIKEILELIAGLKEVAKLGKAALKDGKIDLNDLALLSQLLVKQQVLVAALDGLSELGPEVKDLKLDEAMQLVQALVDAAKEVKEA
jgi:hypothetical protein